MCEGASVRSACVRSVCVRSASVRSACVRSTCEWSNDLCVCKLYKKSNNNATKLEDGWANKVDGEP